MSDFGLARAETMQYHEQYYQAHELFDKGSWLEHADLRALALVKQLEHKQGIAVLDLGCGVGRNAIPIAQLIKPKGGKVVCVDFLELAINKLLSNSLIYGVEDNVFPARSEIERFDIESNSYDLILAVSVLEHCKSREEIYRVLNAIKDGTKPGGFNRLEFTTDRRLTDVYTGQAIETFVETKLDVDELKVKLEEIYREWTIQELQPASYSEELVRNGQTVLWQSKHLDFVAQRP